MAKPGKRRSSAPVALALVACQRIETRPNPPTSSLIDLIATIEAMTFPFRQDRMAIYLCLTEGYGPVRLSFSVIGSAEVDPPLRLIERTVRFDSPRAILELGVQFSGIVFPSPGEYAVQVWVDGGLLCQRRIQVVQGEMTP